jgi:hypothetical protein
MQLHQPKGARDVPPISVALGKLLQITVHRLGDTLSWLA